MYSRNTYTECILNIYIPLNGRKGQGVQYEKDC